MSDKPITVNIRDAKKIYDLLGKREHLIKQYAKFNTVSKNATEHLKVSSISVTLKPAVKSPHKKNNNEKNRAIKSADGSMWLFTYGNYMEEPREDVSIYLEGDDTLTVFIQRYLLDKIAEINVELMDLGFQFNFESVEVPKFLQEGS